MKVSDCKQLTNINIPENSNLQTIETHLFPGSNLEKKNSISSKVYKIYEYTFLECLNLTKIECANY